MGVKELTDNKRNSQSYYALAISFYLLYGLEETVAFSGYEGFAILEEIDAEITEETCGLKEFEVDFCRTALVVGLGLGDVVLELQLLLVVVEYGYPLVLLAVTDDEFLFHCFFEF